MNKLLFFLLPIFSLLSVGASAIKFPEIQALRQRPDTLGLYEKFEVSFNINNGNEYINPFDPEEIDITAIFTSPSGKKWRIPGFYYYSGGTLWKVRFSPDETGVWNYTITVRDKGGEVSSNPMRFVAIRSTRKGPVVVAANKRYLQHSNGSDFYGVGLWYNDSYTTFNRGAVRPEELDNLKSLGVNFISTFITPLETPGSGLGRYDQNICGRLDELLEMCEERDILLSLNVWFHSYLSETVWGGGNIRWYANPYQQITSARDFYRSDLAWKYQEKLYRYFIARWSYSRALAIWFIVDEVNGTDGWITGDSLVAATWGKKVHDYFKAKDPYNHPTTGTRSGGIREFWHQGYQIFDIAAREIYEAQGFPINKTSSIDSSDVHPLTYSYRNYASENQKLWKGYGKPVINGETGWDHTFYETTMPGYLAMYHNALWVTLATGSAMTPFWWAHSRMVNDNVLTAQITSIRRFTDNIPFAKLTEITPAAVKCLEGDAYGMRSKEMVFGWIVNSRSDVAGEKITISSIPNGRYKLRIYHTWRGLFIEEKEVTCSEGAISFGSPFMRITGGHASYIGQDLAFILERLPEPAPLPEVPKKTRR
ncbi:MAG: DUF5060 domain-containing protein [Bacteroidales bacterium]|nr:DUF5060 domain-containing protein [Bacteroidales bacterium]